ALNVVTTREPAGIVDRLLGTDPVLTLARGPLLAEDLAGYAPIEPVPALHGAKGGAYIDWDERTIHYWLGKEEPSWLPQLLADAWPGWAFRRNEAALTGHFTLTGRDPAPVRIDRTWCAGTCCA